LFRAGSLLGTIGALLVSSTATVVNGTAPLLCFLRFFGGGGAGAGRIVVSSTVTSSAGGADIFANSGGKKSKLFIV